MGRFVASTNIVWKHICPQNRLITVTSYEPLGVSNHGQLDSLTVCLWLQQRNHQSYALLSLFVGNTPMTGSYPHQRPIRRKAFSCHKVIMCAIMLFLQSITRPIWMEKGYSTQLYWYTIIIMVMIIKNDSVFLGKKEMVHILETTFQNVFSGMGINNI